MSGLFALFKTMVMVSVYLFIIRKPSWPISTSSSISRIGVSPCLSLIRKKKIEKCTDKKPGSLRQDSINMRADVCIRYVFFNYVWASMFVFAIFTICIGIIKPGICDNIRFGGLTINQYLIGIGIICTVLAIVIILSIVGIDCAVCVRFSTDALIITSCLYILFNIIVCVSIILTINVPCIQLHMAHDQYVLLVCFIIPCQSVLSMANALLHIRYRHVIVPVSMS